MYKGTLVPCLLGTKVRRYDRTKQAYEQCKLLKITVISYHINNKIFLSFFYQLLSIFYEMTFSHKYAFIIFARGCWLGDKFTFSCRATYTQRIARRRFNVLIDDDCCGHFRPRARVPVACPHAPIVRDRPTLKWSQVMTIHWRRQQPAILHTCWLSSGRKPQQSSISRP